MSDAKTTPTYSSGSASVLADGSSSTPEQRAEALAFLQRLAADVSDGNVDLPCFSNVVVRISEALMDPNTTSEQVVTIVGAEPRLAARLLQTANSAAFHTAGKPVTDLRSAVTRIGQQMVQSIAISYAIKQMEYEDSLRSIAQPLADLWGKSIAVACTCQLLAERTKVPADAAFLTGLLHGIGSLYIMAHVATRSSNPAEQSSRMEALGGWQDSIGKAVLESWGFAEDMCCAVAEQHDYERRWQREAGLTDVLIVGVLLAEALKMPEPRHIPMEGVSAFASLGLNVPECEATLLRAERRIAVVYDALK
jgi:HD-like signal output (HDOD) protein